MFKWTAHNENINKETLCTLEDPWHQDVLGLFCCHHTLIPIHVSGKTVCQ